MKREDDRFLLTIEECLKPNSVLSQTLRDNFLQKPPIRQAEIEDKDKGDFFAKVIALMQSLSLGVSICVRWAQDIVSPQLEILTLVFAI